MVASAESSQARPAVGRGVGRPSHLLSWPGGQETLDSAPTVVDGTELDELLDPDDAEAGLGAWFRSARLDGHAVVAAVFSDHQTDTESGSGLDLADLTRSAVDLDDGPDIRRVFTGDTMPTSLRALRRWATEQLAGRQFPIEEIVLVLSELATNVERHAEGWLTVDLVETQGVLLVAVTDPSVDRFPAPRNVGPEELTGRGLLVVASLSLAWGVVVRSASKTVWAAVPCSPAS